MLAARSHPVAVAVPSMRAWIAPLGWVAIVVAGHLVGQAIYDRDPLDRIGAPPLVGSYDLRIGAALLPAVALAALALVHAPALAQRLRWGRLLVATWAGAGAWAVALAASGGLGAIAAPLRTRYEYLAAVPLVGDPGRFLHGFVTALPTYPTHVKGHPPGFVLVLWALDRIGLGGAEVAAALVVAAGAFAVPAALVALRATAGESDARRAAPYVAFAPAAVWVATSADALFAGVAATGIACFALATGRPGHHAPSARATMHPGEHASSALPTIRPGDHAPSVRATRPPGRRAGAVLGLVAGLVLGAALMLSYGLVPLGLIVLALAVVRRAWLALAAAAAGVLAVLGTFAALGFEWLHGLHATRVLYASGVAAHRPHAAFELIDLAAFALAIGPAAFVGLARLRERGVWLLAAPAIAAIAVAGLSGLSKGEVERIWLPFVPWILVATASLGVAASGRRTRAGRRTRHDAAVFVRSRGWLATQLLLGLALQAGVRSPW